MNLVPATTMKLSDGTEVDLRLSVSRLMKLEKALNKPLQGIAMDLETGKLGMVAIVAIIEAACASKADSDRVVNDLDNQGFGAIRDVLDDLFDSSMGKKKDTSEQKDEASASGNVQEPVEVT